MLRFTVSILLGLAAVPQTFAEASIPLPHRLVHQFPDGVWAENIHVRPNGNLLISTSTPNASVYQVHEPWTENPVVNLVHTFDDYVDRLIGIGQSTEDKYVVVGSRFDTTAVTGVPYNGTWATMELDFTGNRDIPATRLIARMPETYLLQSVVALPNNRETVLISDQFLKSQGLVWRLDTRTGDYSIAIDGLPEMNTDETIEGVGVNGIKIRGTELYFANSNQGNMYRLQIDATGAVASGASPLVAAHYDYSFFYITFADTGVVKVFDDFTFGPHNLDTIWVTGNTDNRLLAVGLDGETIVVLGNGTDSILPAPTACQFGKVNDTTILYVTGRERTLPVNGTYIIGGWVRAVDVTGFSL